MGQIFLKFFTKKRLVVTLIMAVLALVLVWPDEFSTNGRYHHISADLRRRLSGEQVLGMPSAEEAERMQGRESVDKSDGYGTLPAGPLRPVPPVCVNETGIEDRHLFCNPLAPDDPGHYHLAAQARKATSGTRRGTFLFLVQGTGWPSRFWETLAERTDSRLLWLSWRRAVPAERQREAFVEYIYFPNSSFNRGRNRLLRRGLELEIEQGWLFEYYVFMDEDQEFMEFKNREDMEIVDQLFTGTNRSPTTVAMLIHLLMKYRPARAGIRVDKSYYASVMDGLDKRIPCTTSTDLDGNVEAIHRSALDAMMPYVSKYDEVVVWVGNSMMNVRADVLLGPFSVKFNQLITYIFRGKQKHTSYPYLEFLPYRRTLYCFISSCMSSEAERAMNLYPKEVSSGIYSRIHSKDDAHTYANSSPCFEMASSVDYSALLSNDRMKDKYWFHA